MPNWIWIRDSAYGQGTLTLPVLHINHTFSIWVAKVGSVGRSIMNHTFIYRICCLVWKNAWRETRNAFLHLYSATKETFSMSWPLLKRATETATGKPCSKQWHSKLYLRDCWQQIGSLLGTCQVDWPKMQPALYLSTQLCAMCSVGPVILGTGKTTWRILRTQIIQ